MKENDKKNLFIKSLNINANYKLILTEDCFLLLEKLDNDNGKIAFWSSLFAITNLRLDKFKKDISINFYDEETDSEYQIKLYVHNILLFRDSLVKKMRVLKVKVDSNKIMKGKQQFKNLTEEEIKEMRINSIEKNCLELKERILQGEITDYTINTFTILCGKAIEYFSMIRNEKYKEYLKMMKKILQLDKINKLNKYYNY